MVLTTTQNDGVVSILTIDGRGNHHRTTLAPGAAIDKHPQEVQDACRSAWTPEIVASYAKKMSALMIRG